MAVTVDKMFFCSNLGARSFGDGSQGICKYKISNLGQFAGFKGRNYPQISFFDLYVMNATMNKLSALSMFQCMFFVSFAFVARRGHVFV